MVAIPTAVAPALSRGPLPALHRDVLEQVAPSRIVALDQSNLPGAPHQAIGHADVKRPIPLAGKDVDVIGHDLGLTPYGPRLKAGATAVKSADVSDAIALKRAGARAIGRVI